MILYNNSIDDVVPRLSRLGFNYKMDHEKCWEIDFLLNAYIVPILVARGSEKEYKWTFKQGQ